MAQDENLVESAFQSKINIRSYESKNGRKISWKIKRRGETTQQGKCLPCNFCKKANQLGKNCCFRDKLQCYLCKTYGHLEKDCRLKINYQVNYVEEKESEDNIFYTGEVASDETNYMWYIDSGCSKHMM